MSYLRKLTFPFKIIANAILFLTQPYSMHDRGTVVHDLGAITVSITVSHPVPYKVAACFRQ